jgi:hypothetical protein
MAAQSILKRSASNDTERDQWVPIKVEPPIRYVVPQKLAFKRIRNGFFRKLFPWPAIQVEYTIKNGSLEAWSGTEKIWKNRFRKLIANTRYPIPVEKFDWNRISSKNGVTLRIRL